MQPPNSLIAALRATKRLFVFNFLLCVCVNLRFDGKNLVSSSLGMEHISFDDWQNETTLAITNQRLKPSTASGSSRSSSTMNSTKCPDSNGKIKDLFILHTYPIFLQI